MVGRWVALLAVPVLGCEANHPLPDAKDYRSDCVEASDCAAVVPTKCGCLCETLGLRKSEVSRWNAALADADVECTQQTTCGPCPESVVSCTAGRCEVSTKH